MIDAILRACLVAVVLVLAGCASTGRGAGTAEPLPPTDVPAAFLVADDGRLRPPLPEDRCRTTLVDPRDDTQLRLVRSREGWGDYSVPPGRYGVGDGFLLRVECATGIPLGIVPRD
ncbi:MAG: hypothetical protein KBD01_02460 [Acidobacteria bacterium]|nr:hypothetical protein [Acidobacteriota bacterium]